MNEVQQYHRLIGRVESGVGNAGHWLARFNAEYARKLGMPIHPGSLNLRLTAPFDWADPAYSGSLITFDRAEYGGERDILFLPCRLEELQGHPAFLWTTTTPRAAAERSLVEVITDISLRGRFGLRDGDLVTIAL